MMKNPATIPKIIGYLFTLILGSVLLIFSNETGYAKSTVQGWLGVGISEITPSIRREAGLKDQTGILINAVYDNSPAEDADLKESDIILKYDGKSVQYVDELVEMVQNTHPKSKVKLEIFRDGKTIDKKVAIGKKKNYERHYSLPYRQKIRISHDRPYLGAQVQDLSKDLAEYFQVEEYKGVVITEVVAGSPAEKAGLKSGDVITKIGDEAIHFTEDLYYSLKDYKKGAKVAVEIVRKGKTQTVEVTLDAKERSEINIRKHGIHLDHDFNIDRFGDLEIDLEDLEIDLDQIIDNMENTLEKLFNEIGIQFDIILPL
ncbi:MAG: PDZ domain-containing protein [Candidatus Marinimicrobia bacterium]|nr:PDZ domain-containing protein [Candidatus Neomarinimicrobiota bacterium]